MDQLQQGNLKLMKVHGARSCFKLSVIAMPLAQSETETINFHSEFESTSETSAKPQSSFMQQYLLMTGDMLNCKD